MVLGPGTLKAFQLDSFLIASAIHLVTSLLVGLLYGAMLPMFPRHPILFGGVIAPVFGPVCCTACSSSSIRFSVNASTGCGSSFPNSPSASLPGSWWHARTASPSQHSSPSPFAQASRRQARMDERKTRTAGMIVRRPLLAARSVPRSARAPHAAIFPAGRPNASIPIDPTITDFNLLYREKLRGMPRPRRKGGAALSLGDPVYLAIADDATFRSRHQRIPGTSMPAFAKSAGGMLTDKQIDVIVHGIRDVTRSPTFSQASAPPPYASSEPGDATRGAAVYATFCSSCHGPDGKGGAKASSIVDGSFLALVSDQDLRTLVIVGRPELGAPDWRNNVPGKPMSAQEISDVVAWLAAQRPQFAGRPYPNAAKPAGELP